MRVSLPEQVWIDYEPASFGSRALAYVFDAIVQWSIFGAVALGLFILTPLYKYFLQIGGTFSTVVFLLGLFAWAWAYPIYFEVYRDGVTPGKRVMGLRVVDERGLPITLRASFLRNALLIVDFMPAMGTVAFFSMFFTAKSQRLGDLVARTMVVHERSEDAVPESTGGGEDPASSTVIPLQLYNIIERFLVRRESLSEDARAKTTKAIFSAISQNCPSLAVPPFLTRETAEDWLSLTFKTLKPMRTAQAQTKVDSLDWHKVESKLRTIEEDLAALSSERTGQSAQKLLGVAQSYQLVCQLYAYLSTFYPDTRAATRAAQLVRFGRRVIYGKRLSIMKEERKRFLLRVADSFHAVRYHIAASVLLTAVPAVLAAVLIQINPELAWSFLSEEMHDNLKQGKLWTENLRGMGAIGSSAIMVNNIKVSFNAFALGITGGVGTAAVLILNGINLGCIFSALTFYGMAGRLADFVVGHGVLELSVIAVAGGCGLYLGDALVRPGDLSRRDALAEHARIIVDLVLFCVPSLVAAGLVEGFISPQAYIPFGAKLALGLLLGYLYWGYLLTGRFLPDLFSPLLNGLTPARTGIIPETGPGRGGTSSAPQDHNQIG